MDKHVVVGARRHEMKAHALDGWGGEATVKVAIRWIGTVQPVNPDGTQAAPVSCRHRRGGLDASESFPHQTADEALACARRIAGGQWAGLPVVEADL